MFSFLLSIIHFVCPLIFFTHFTRNPYQTQITMLHLSILLIALTAAAWYLAKPDSPRLKALLPAPVFMPILIFSLYALATTALAWWRHPAFFRDSILAEGLRVNQFWWINVVGAIWLGSVVGRRLSQDNSKLWSLDLPTFIAGAIFACGWVFFDKVRTPPPHSLSTSVMAYIFDPYGAFLWAAMLSWLVLRFISKGASLVLTINFMTGALASIYGVGQYFGWDVIWTRSMNPYGARAISTFGNPNFLSPYLVLLIPAALIGFSQAKKLSSRIGWALLCLIYEAGLLATLTRSSWAGAAAASAAVFFYVWRGRREGERPSWKPYAVLAVLGLTIFTAWPTGFEGQGEQSPIKRLAETAQMFQKKENDPKWTYQPASQRFLIWSVCWQFVKERPWLGKGWGNLELFYPFYQGPLLYQNRFERLRTHANNGHDEIIEVWSQTGIVGMGLALWFIAALFIWGIRNLKTLESGASRNFCAALLAGTLGVLVDNILNVSLHFAVPGYLFWWQAGVLMAIYPGKGERGDKSEVGDRSKGVSWHLSPLSLQSLFSRYLLAPLIIVCGVWLGTRAASYWVSEFYYFRGFILHREGKLQAALDRLLSSYRWFPREVNRNYELGNVYARLDNLEKAEWAYSEALKANSGYDEIFLNRGILNASRGNWESALKDYLVSLYINPTQYAAYVSLINIFMKDPKAHGDRVLRVMERALHFYPKDRDLLNNMGSFTSTLKGPGNSGEYFLKAVEVDPNYPIAARNLAAEIAAMARSGRKAEARDLWMRWKAVTPNVVPAAALGL